MSEIFSADSTIVHIWKKLQGAGRSVLQVISENVLQPIKNTFSPRPKVQTHRHSSAQHRDYQAYQLNKQSTTTQIATPKSRSNRCRHKKGHSLPRCLRLRIPAYRRDNFRNVTKRTLAALRFQNNTKGSSLRPGQRSPPISTTTTNTLEAFRTSGLWLLETYGPYPTETSTEVPENANVICKRCACVESTVQCRHMNISEPFKLQDWNELADFAPISVDLSQNPFSNITVIGNLPILVLNISNCHVNHFEPASLMYLQDLKTLDLSKNRITTSNLIDLSEPQNNNSQPQPFKKMLNLNLSHNAIHSLPSALFTLMSNLRRLDLSGNPLAYIDAGTLEAISGLAQLKRLLLRNCDLEILSTGFFTNQKKLRWLDLSNNRFTVIPSVLQEVPRLSFLSLDRNPITSIGPESSITKLTNLEVLHLSHMSRLQNITAGALGGLLKLNILRLNHNPRLTYLDPNFLMYRDADKMPQWPTLREFHLNDNNLSTISPKFLEDWDDLAEGDFSNNPYVCDCHSQWMVNDLIPLLRSLPESRRVYQMVCHKPTELRGVTFGHMSNASQILPCADVKTNQQQKNLMMTFGTMTAIVATIPVLMIFVILLWNRVRRRKKLTLGPYSSQLL